MMKTSKTKRVSSKHVRFMTPLVLNVGRIDAEGDEYDLDFQSTDEEADAVDGENAIQAEAREARKVSWRTVYSHFSF